MGAFMAGLEKWVKGGSEATKVGREAAGISKRAGSWYGAAMLGAAAIGAGTAIAGHHPLRGIVDNAMDMAFYDPLMEDQGVRGRDYDNMILGRDIGFGEMFPAPTIFGMSVNPKAQTLPFLPFNYYQLKSINSEGFKNATAAEKNDIRMQRFIGGQLAAKRQDIAATGYTDSDPWVAENYGYSDKYRPSAYRGPNASEDIVFGLNNMR